MFKDRNVQFTELLACTVTTNIIFAIDKIETFFCFIRLWINNLNPSMSPSIFSKALLKYYFKHNNFESFQKFRSLYPFSFNFKA
jgi:hypothetical protein